MEIRVKCNCGSVFSFEETLENNRVKFPVSCLACGADCTAKANEYVAYKLTPAPPVENTPAWKRWLGLKPKRHEFDELELSDPKTGEKEAADPINGDETSSRRVALAAGASLLVGFAGALGWLWLTQATGWEFGYVAWALGGLTGGTSYLLAPRGHRLLGKTAALAAFISIGGGQYLVGLDIVERHVDKEIPAAYADALSYAHDTVAATSDDDLRPEVARYKLESAVAGDRAGNTVEVIQTFQVDDLLRYIGGGVHNGSTTIQAAERDQVGDVANVTENDISRFKLKVLPELRALGAGKPSETEYKNSLSQKVRSQITVKAIAIEALNPYTILWIGLGIVTAYRLARNAALEY